MPNTNTTSFVNTPLEKLIADLILGSQTLDKGVAQLLQGYRKEISLNRFYVDGDNITIPPADGKFGNAPNGSFHKDERLIELGELYWENEYNVRDYNIDHEFLWTTGPTGMMEPSNILQEAIRGGATSNFNNQLDRVLWREAIGSPLAPLGGWDAQFVADDAIMGVAPVVITAANVIATFETYIQKVASDKNWVEGQVGPNTGGNPAVLEMSNPSFVVPNRVLALYREAARALPNKGTDITDEIMNQYGGYKIIGVNGMLPDTVLFGNVGGGEDTNLKVGVWADSDRTNVEMARTGPLDETFGVKIASDVGAGYVYGQELAYTKV